ncbi:MAG: hypothetical protein K9M54_02350 [Kiritimatiellales bacterium]|nr:hypothetical protein [Kiritimatiellales bacterium]MCF7864492.1 hypothetical protein [Kiritimatiellales bacterium]
MKLLHTKRLIATMVFGFGSISGATDSSWKTIATNTTIYGKTGVAFNSIAFHRGDTANRSLAWGFGELGATSGKHLGLQGGIYTLVPVELWESQPGNYETVFRDDYALRDLYLDFTIPGTKTTLSTGRKKFVKTPAVDGDSHQGFQIQIKDIKQVGITASIVDRWINNSVTFLDADGIDGWKDVGETTTYADDYFYSAQAELYLVPGRLSVTPFFNWLDNVMGAAGSRWDFTQPINEEWAFGFDGYYNVFINDHPKSIHPEYSNVDMTRIHMALKHQRGFVGLGYYAYGKGTLPTKLGIFDRDDPLDQDDLIGTPQNDTDMYYADCVYDTDRLRIKTKYGIGENRPLAIHFQEFNFWVFYDITEHIEAGLYFIYTDYSTRAEYDYHRTGTSLLYKF